MRLSPILLSACLLAAGSGMAQQNETAKSAVQPAGEFQIQPRADDALCPVSLTVSSQKLVYLYDAKDQTSTPAKIPSQHIELSLTNLQAESVVALYAHVQGIPGVPHLSFMPLKTGSGIVLTLQPNHSPTPGPAQAPGPTPLSAIHVQTPDELPAPVPFHASLSLGAHSTDSLEWTIENVGGIRWVQIDRVVYADGSEWRRVQSGSCKSTPNPITLINDASLPPR